MEISLGKRLGWIRFLADNIGVAKALAGLLQEWLAADSIDAKAEVLKGLIDVLKGVWASLPTDAEPVVAGDVMALVAAESDTLELKFGDGALLKALLDNLPKLIAIYQALKPFLG